MDRFNLFRFAPTELSHAAFWSWIFQSTDADDDNDRLDGPRGVGESAIRLLDKPIPPGTVEIETEVSLDTRPRPDLRVKFADGHSLFVELKKKEAFSEAQIRRYQEAIGEEDRVALISTHFDAEKAEDVCPYLGVDDLREILWTYRDSHPLLSDYADWIDWHNEKWEEIEAYASSDEPAKVEAALSTLFGQKLVMEAITAPLDGWMQQGQNRSGTPYTEFRIAEATADQDTLFYCTDEYAPGHYISLKQYLGSRDHEAWDGKEERLRRLRQWWDEASAETDHSLTFRTPHNNGSKTREVACLLFQNNAPSLLSDDLPRIHEAFTDKLAENGWKLGVNR